MSALSFDRVAFDYGDDVHALRAVSLSIARGERVALVGANGAGKTTLLMLATGFLAPSSGTVHVGNEVVGPRSLRSIRKRLAVMFADPDDQLFCPTVLDEVMFAARQRGERNDDEARSILARVGLEGFEGREPLGLSLGEKKRLTLATVLSTRADVLLLDEPTSGLDPRGRRRFLDLIATLEPAVLIATHDLDAVRLLEMRVVLLDHGTVAADGPARAVLDDAALLEAHGL